MGKDTQISWCDSTFNGWIGCTKVSPGCDHCYAEALDKRHRWKGAEHWGINVPRMRTSEANWKQPIAWNKKAATAGKRHLVFCASLADVFDNEVPNHWRSDLFDLIGSTPALTWLLLTKRIGNAGPMMAALQRPLTPPPNVWLGASVVNQEEADRDIPKLLATPAAKRFVSYEPALGPVDFRPWLGYNPLHATNKPGRCSICGGTVRVDRGARGRFDLEGGAAQKEPMGRSDYDAASRTAPDRRARGGRLPDREDDGGRAANVGAGPSTRLEGSQWPDSSRTDDQSQERKEARQPSSELGACHVFGTSQARGQGPAGWPDGETERGGQPHGKTECRCGQRDQAASSSGRGAHDARHGVRGVGQDDLEDRASRTVGISWLICGGESAQGGAKARPFDLKWARSSIEQCKAAGVPVFVKQLGSNCLDVPPGKPAPFERPGTKWRMLLKDRAGADPAEWPDHLRVQEFP